MLKQPSAKEKSSHIPANPPHAPEKDLRKNLFVLSAPSATGKNTVYDILKLRMPFIERAVTATTRQPRTNEQDGIDYYFYDQTAFLDKVANGDFIEHALYDRDYYATPISEIHKYDVHTPVFLLVNTEGMHAVLEKYPLSTTLFLAPPSLEELAQRMRLRGENTPEEIRQRLAKATQEIRCADQYQYVFKNQCIASCADEMETLLRKRFKELGLLQNNK